MKKNNYSLFIIGCLFFNGCGDYTEDLSGNFYFYSESATDNIIEKHGSRKGDKFIPCNVVAYDYNDEFIIAAQRPTEECFIGTGELMLNRDSIYFWIIAHEQQLFFGPLMMDEFEKKRKELNIPEKLKLNLKENISN